MYALGWPKDGFQQLHHVHEAVLDLLPQLPTPEMRDRFGPLVPKLRLLPTPPLYPVPLDWSTCTQYHSFALPDRRTWKFRKSSFHGH